MNWLRRKAQVLLETEFAAWSAYRVQIVIQMLSGTLSVVMLLVWMNQASTSPGGQIQGYTAAHFAAYFLASWLVNELLSSWVGGEMEYTIRSGRLSSLLLRPVDPMWVYYAQMVSERLVRLLPTLLLFGAGVWLTGATFTRDWRVYPAVLGLLVLGFNVWFLWEYLFGLLAFWTESSDDLAQLGWLLYITLGGLIAPLTLLPTWVQGVAHWTPFPYLLGLPAELLAGKAVLAQAGEGIVILAGWLLVFWGLRTLMWHFGLKRYGAVGA